jgi:hypothetical protein
MCHGDLDALELQIRSLLSPPEEKKGGGVRGWLMNYKKFPFVQLLISGLCLQKVSKKIATFLLA